ncbi:hypothetical protein ACET3X_007757 [Alternaria dauci]|uniref:Uncharacterized protein n=1 Tax=Alternaria dauci TaxID=48095 RepID=A0ABR3UCV9_9PLEO
MSLISSEVPETSEETGKGYPEPETDELGRVKIANKYATDMGSKQTYGRLLSPENKIRMDLWVERLPYDWQLEDANTARLAGVKVYGDWLDWLESKAFSWLEKLSTFERHFRIAGVAYHKIPYALRHSSTLVNGYQIDNVILLRMSQIFETSCPRSQQSFFRPWTEIFNTANEVLKELKMNKNKPEDVHRLRSLESGLEITLSQLAKPLRILENALVWVEEQVAHLTRRSNLDGSDNLAAKHSREGGLFRIWIQSFPEIEWGSVELKSNFTESFVVAVLEDGEIMDYTYCAV